MPIRLPFSAPERDDDNRKPIGHFPLMPAPLFLFYLFVLFVTAVCLAFPGQSWLASPYCLVLLGWEMVVLGALVMIVLIEVIVSRDKGGRPSAISIEMLRAMSGSDFERWVASLFRAMDYRARNTPDHKDHGVDIWLETPEGRRGIVQCKQMRHSVGEPLLRDLLGTMHAEKAEVAFFVTSGRFTKEAKTWGNKQNIVLWDGDDLVALARRYAGTMESRVA